MSPNELKFLKQSYETDGYVSPVDIISKQYADKHRQQMENVEANFGKLHYLTKVHTILRSPWKLATLPAVLDVVEQFIGSNILLHNVTYIVKEPGSEAHVSWHQDLTYWGFSDDAQVSMWLALSPATQESGCMRMLPGSHLQGRLRHDPTNDESNVLFQGQTVRGVADDKSVLCPLRPGQASFHHGWTLHSSTPNTSTDRRIGLNVQYLATHVRQTRHDSDTAIPVRGEDSYHHFSENIPAWSNLDPVAVKRQQELQDRYRKITGTP